MDSDAYPKGSLRDVPIWWFDATCVPKDVVGLIREYVACRICGQTLHKTEHTQHMTCVARQYIQEMTSMAVPLGMMERFATRSVICASTSCKKRCTHKIPMQGVVSRFAYDAVIYVCPDALDYEFHPEHLDGIVQFMGAIFVSWRILDHGRTPDEEAVLTKHRIALEWFASRAKKSS